MKKIIVLAIVIFVTAITMFSGCVEQTESGKTFQNLSLEQQQDVKWFDKAVEEWDQSYCENIDDLQERETCRNIVTG